MKTGVLIVGAGPSGLTAANLLARYGIDFIIIDNEFRGRQAPPKLYRLTFACDRPPAQISAC